MSESSWNKTIFVTTLPRKQATRISLPFDTLAEGLRENRYRVKEMSPGDRLGRYEVGKLIGSGGFSSIHYARHIYLDHRVALKILRSAVPIEAEMFLREAQALALLAHRNVVRVFDADILDGVPFIVMELLVGKSLVTVLDEYERLSVQRTMDLMEQLGSVLAKQEEKGVLHLDIKPGNIFQRDDGSFCLFDYGLVGVSQPPKEPASQNRASKPPTLSPKMFGTPAYMSPEQVSGKADHRSDLYSLGLTVWECLVGTPAREVSQLPDLKEAVMTPIRSCRTIHDNIPVELDSIVSHLLATSPEDRYQSANNMLADLLVFRYGDRNPIGPIIGIAFVAIPFLRSFTEAFTIINSACASVKLRARRLDQHVFLQDIWTQCSQEIEASRVVIADFTGVTSSRYPNPNVVTEAAHARAIGKPLVLITQGKPEDLPFDWRQMRVLTYDKSEQGLKRLADHLASTLKHVLQNQESH